MAIPFSLARDMSGPAAMSSIGGTGLPSMTISHGQSQQIPGMMSGIGAPNGMDVNPFNTGRFTSTMDPVSNPRGTISTQYFVLPEVGDASNPGTNFENDLGDFELYVMDCNSGPPGIVGQRRPHRIISVSRFNDWMEQEEQRLEYGSQKSPRWFTEQWGWVGGAHNVDTKGRMHAQQGDLCQKFETGFRGTCYDYWQAVQSAKTATQSMKVGPEVGDNLYFLLQRLEYVSKLPGATKADAQQYYWRLTPWYSKSNGRPEMSLLVNRKTGSIDLPILVGKLAVAYGAPESASQAREHARSALNRVKGDASYREDLLKLRRIEIEHGNV